MHAVLIPAAFKQAQSRSVLGLGPGAAVAAGKNNRFHLLQSLLLIQHLTQVLWICACACNDHILGRKMGSQGHDVGIHLSFETKKNVPCVVNH